MARPDLAGDGRVDAEREGIAVRIRALVALGRGSADLALPSPALGTVDAGRGHELRDEPVHRRQTAFVPASQQISPSLDADQLARRAVVEIVDAGVGLLHPIEHPVPEQRAEVLVVVLAVLPVGCLVLLRGDVHVDVRVDLGVRRRTASQEHQCRDHRSALGRHHAVLGMSPPSVRARLWPRVRLSSYRVGALWAHEPINSASTAESAA